MSHLYAYIIYIRLFIRHQYRITSQSHHISKNWIRNHVGFTISFYEMEFSSQKKVNGDRLPIYLYPTFLQLYYTQVFCRFFLNQNKHEVSILRCLCGSHSLYHQTFSADFGGSLKHILYTFSSNFRPILNIDFKLFYHLNEKEDFHFFYLHMPNGANNRMKK